MTTNQEKQQDQNTDVWNAMQTVIGCGAIAGFFANQAMWFYIALYIPEAKDISPGILAILNQGSGGIMTFAGMVIGYYFGSSKSSADKDAAQKLSTKVAASAATTAAETLNKVLSGGTGPGDPHATTVSVVPPAPPDSVNVETKITKTRRKANPSTQRKE